MLSVDFPMLITILLTFTLAIQVSSLPLTGTPTPGPRTTTTYCYGSVLGGFCEADANCKLIVSGLKCINRKCVCAPGLVPNGRLGCSLNEGTLYMSLRVSTF
jgi:hypothetical protein